MNLWKEVQAGKEKRKIQKGETRSFAKCPEAGKERR